MFVPEGKMFNPSSVRVRLSSMEGCVAILDVAPECTVDQLRLQGVTHIYEGSEGAKKSLYYRVLHVDSGKILEEDSTLAQNAIKDNDELLLVKKRFAATPGDSASVRAREDSKKSPTADAIKAATQDLAPINTDKRAINPLAVLDFKAELRKILVSLIDAAQKILCLNPEAVKIFQEAEKYMDDQMDEEPKKPEVDPSSLEQLTGMGFSGARARKALLLNRMSTSEAVQWLLEHDGEEDAEERVSESPGPSSSSLAAHKDLPVAESQGDQQGNDSKLVLELSKLSGPQKVMRMLETFRAYRRKEFKPSSRALKNLIEMGFSEKDSIDALRVHGNRQEEACEWLLNGGSSKVSLEDLEDGLDEQSPIYRAIMANPVVQLGISNPRSLIAFLMILENPDCTQQWLNDPDTSAMLIQISRIYHAERNAPR